MAKSFYANTYNGCMVCATHYNLYKFDKIFVHIYYVISCIVSKMWHLYLPLSKKFFFVMTYVSLL